MRLDQFSAFIGKFSGQEKYITLSKFFIEVCEDYEAAALLSQLVSMCNKTKDGIVPAKSSYLERKLSLTPRRLRTAKKKLIDKNLIHQETKFLDGANVSHYRVNYPKIAAILFREIFDEFGIRIDLEFADIQGFVHVDKTDVSGPGDQGSFCLSRQNQGNQPLSPKTEHIEDSFCLDRQNPESQGFVYMDKTAQNPRNNLVPIENQSFSDVDGETPDFPDVDAEKAFFDNVTVMQYTGNQYTSKNNTSISSTSISSTSIDSNKRANTSQDVDKKSSNFFLGEQTKSTGNGIANSVAPTQNLVLSKLRPDIASKVKLSKKVIVGDTLVYVRDVYANFCKERGSPAIFDSARIKNLKSMIEIAVDTVRGWRESGVIKVPDDDIDAVKGFFDDFFMHENWNKLEPYLRNKTDLLDIKRNFAAITNFYLNGPETRTQAARKPAAPYVTREGLEQNTQRFAEKRLKNRGRK